VPALLERAFLGKCVAGQSCAFGRLRYFHARRLGVGSGQTRWTQQRKLREYFAVQLCHEIILAVRIVTPDLSELNRLYRHSLTFSGWYMSDYSRLGRASIDGGVTEGQCNW